ncbi:hypothetical protein MYAM1_001875 [Malassezia yamatoensis]|uniref:Prenylcysteine lyase domain-containing protein n=1 Tax=Malassezia yamatoensis TaxID=253288 RepID=A0AAJ5YS46_9BASI|nr:hypothetical protein MYAM1_001875 [Malassezia yamatoensis]
MRLYALILCALTGSLYCDTGVTAATKILQNAYIYPQDTQNPLTHNTCPSRGAASELHVAIVGAGASGASAAYFLSKAQEQLQQQGLPECGASRGSYSIHISVYERSNRIGGRVCEVYPLDDESLAPIEIGASGIKETDFFLLRAAREFGLHRVRRPQKSRSRIGVWDGEQFLLDDLDESRWNQWRTYWRYGNGLKKASNLANSVLQSFQRIYSPKFLHDPHEQHGYPWTGVQSIAQQLDVGDLVTQSTHDYFVGHDIPVAVTDELIGAALRANYAQDTMKAHAYAGVASVSLKNQVAIQGGNALLLENMLVKSNATRHFGANGDVTGIMKMESIQNSSSTVRWKIATRDGHEGTYDMVMLATPWHASGITLLNTERTVPKVDFQRMTTTLVVTDAAEPDSTYFGFEGSHKRVPLTILTTSKEGTTNQPEFITLSYLRDISHYQLQGTRYKRLHVVRLHSQDPIPDETLDRLFGAGHVFWKKEKSWHAYPKMSPNQSLDNFEIDTSLFHLNAMEKLVSSMETSALTAKNVAALVLERWLGSRFIHGYDCKWTSRPHVLAEGWDKWGCMGS